MKKIPKNKEISLVIGSIYQDLNALFYLLSKLGDNLSYIKEIICVVSGVNTNRKLKRASKLNEIIKIKSEIIYIERIIMPGEARNIGINKSKYEYICFLDSHPIPESNWLSKTIDILEKKNLKGLIGNLEYIPTNEFEDCFIAATYGKYPILTIPGTLIEKKSFMEIGLFIPNYRSGEDAEWIRRSKLLNPRLSQVKPIPCKYIGLKGMNFIELCKKWYTYYKTTIDPRIYSQRIIYISFLISFFLLLAFSWNDKVANWDQNSFYYVPHISKIVISLIVAIYFIYRMIILPLKKKVKILDFNLIKFIKFIYISTILDLVKLTAFIVHKK